MIVSMALIFLVGMILAAWCRRWHIPGILGMMAAGMVLGPFGLDALDTSFLTISPDIRRIALIVILMRAGLALDLTGLKRVARPTLLLCVVPAFFEMLAVLLLAPRLFGISNLEAALLGSVVIALSPAAIIPKMLYLMKEGYGTDKHIPQMLIAGTAGDNIIVLLLFATLLPMAEVGDFSGHVFGMAPLALCTGVFIGMVFAKAILTLIRRRFLQDISCVLAVLSVAFLMAGMERVVTDRLPYSGLLAVVVFCMTVRHQAPQMADILMQRYTTLWVPLELLLFVLVGVQINPLALGQFGFRSVLLVIGALLVRLLGVSVCLLGSTLNRRERAFCLISCTAKATVQASIGMIPLSLHLPVGNIIWPVAIVAIVITAPLGTIGMETIYRAWLKT